MRIIAFQRMVDFYQENPDSKIPLELWFSRLKALNPKKNQDLRHAGTGVTLIGNNRAVFEITNLEYRLISIFNLPKQTVYVRWLGNAAAFEKINAHTIILESGMEPNPIKPIRTKADLKASLERIDALLNANPEPKTDLADELEVLTILVHAYEQVHYPIEIPDPIEALKFLMEEKKLQQKDLEPHIGPKSRVSEILNRKRYFTCSRSTTFISFLNSRWRSLLMTKPLKASKYQVLPVRRIDPAKVKQFRKIGNFK